MKECNQVVMFIQVKPSWTMIAKVKADFLEPEQATINSSMVVNPNCTFENAMTMFGNKVLVKYHADTRPKESQEPAT